MAARVPSRPMLPKVVKLSGVQHLRYEVPANSLVNLVRGVTERVFCYKGGSPPTPIKVVSFSTFTSRLMATLKVPPKWRHEQFVASYSGRKRDMYQRASESLLRSKVRKRDAHLQVFVKAEKLDFSEGEKIPRIISPRDPRFNLAVGLWLKPLEKPLSYAINDVYGQTTVMKGLNAYQVASHMVSKWKQFNDPVAIDLDVSRFDQHVSTPVLQWEHSVYTSAYRSQELAKLLTWQLKNKCYGRTPDGNIKYTVDGTRMSGDMNTSTGNVLIMCALVYEYAKERNVTISLANNGDDCVVFMERRDLHRFCDGGVEWFRDYGFSVVGFTPVYKIEHIKFCQSQPVQTVNGWIMVRDIKVSMTKSAMTLRPMNSNQDFANWLATVGECGSILSQGVPIMSAYYKLLQRSSPGGVVKLLQTENYEGWYRSRVGIAIMNPLISDHARYSFWLAFGIAPDCQIAMERQLEQAVFQKQIQDLHRVPFGRGAGVWSDFGLILDGLS